MDIEQFGDDEIRCELRRLVKRERATVLKKFEDAKDQMRSHPEARSPSAQATVERAPKEMDEKLREVDQLYDKIFRFIDEKQ